MEKTDRDNIYKDEVSVLNYDYDGLKAYKRKKQLNNQIKRNQERLDALEPKVDEILNILKGNQ